MHILSPDSQCTWNDWMTAVIQNYFHYHGIEDAVIEIEVGYDDMHGETEWIPANDEIFLQYGEPDYQKVAVITRAKLPHGLLYDLKNRITQSAWPYLHKDWYNVGIEFLTPWEQEPIIHCNHTNTIHFNEGITPHIYEIINKLCYCS